MHEEGDGGAATLGPATGALLPHQPEFPDDLVEQGQPAIPNHI